MSRSLNDVRLIGNLTNDPQLKVTANGQKVVTFVVATNRQWVTNGKKNTQTEFTYVSGWNKLAEISNQYLKKGKYVYVQGYLKTLSWDSDEGVRQQRTEVVMQDMFILSPREKRDGDSGDDVTDSADMMDDDFFDPDMEDQAA